MTSGPRDANNIPALIARSSSTNVPIVLYADPTTHRLLVDASSSQTGVTDGEAVDAADTGVLSLGTDGSNYKILKTDSNGELQVDVLSSALPSGAATSALQTTGNSSLSTIAGAVSGTEMQVDVLTMPTTTVQATNLDIRDLSSASDSVAAAQSGTWNITNVSGTVSLPTGASTAAKQPALGTAGTASADVITVQGIASMTALKVDGSAVTQPVSGTFWQATQPVSGTVAVTNAGITTIAGAVSGTEMQVDVVTSALPTGASTLAEQQSQTTHLATIAGDTTSIQTAVELIDDTIATLGTTTYTEAATKGAVIAAVRRDADTTLVNTTNEIGPLQMNAAGQLKVEVFSGETLPVSLTSTTITGTVAVTQSGTWDEIGINDSGNSITVDNNGTFVVQENGAALTALQNIDADVTTVIGHVDGIEALLTTIDVDTSTLSGAVSGSEMQVDVVAALPSGTNAIGRVGHDITGIGHGVTTVTTAGTDVVLAASTTCKKVTIQSQTDNTGLIAVGASGVDATEATGTGIILYPGDSIVLEIDNLNDIYIDSTVSGEGVRYTYLT